MHPTAWKEPLGVGKCRMWTSGEETKMYTKNMRRSFLLGSLAAAVLAAGACEPKTEVNNQPIAQPSPAASASPAISPEVANPDEAALQKMLGKWDGPEGTYINIADKKGADEKQQNPRKFEIAIKNLDKEEKFEGTAKGRDIEFTRKGKTENVRTATGAETGMKGFESEANCLVVTKGSEGFCRKADARSPAASPAASPSVSPANKK